MSQTEINTPAILTVGLLSILFLPHLHLFFIFLIVLISDLISNLIHNLFN